MLLEPTPFKNWTSDTVIASCGWVIATKKAMFADEMHEVVVTENRSSGG